MIDIFKKASEAKETSTQNNNNIYWALQNAQKTPEEPKTPETTEIGQPQTEEPQNALNISSLLTSYQRMRTEEQTLLEMKQQLSATQLDLQGKLVKEIEKKKMVIDSLKTEIQFLESQCKELAIAFSPS
jgi:hypothetical protein